MEPESSLTRSQETAIGHYPKPDESNPPLVTYLFNIIILIIIN